jgi:tetratricopeptide (TPR) repeat protein
VREKKFFAWVHLYDPHTPYDPPEPYASRHPGQPYLGEIAYTDHVVGRLTGWLRERGLTDETLVVLTADHGESLGDHGEAAHAYFIYSATTHVPLIVRTPWGFRGRSRTQVSSVDLMPTVLDLVGLPAQDAIDGRSVARALFDTSADLGHAAYSETYFPRYHYGWQQLVGLRDGRHQLIEAPEPELYDVVRDPGETSNIHKAYSRRAEDLRLRLQAMVKSEGTAAPERRSLDPETLQRLAALGYVGNVVDVDPDAVLPDPKAKLPLFTSMNEAKALAGEERFEDAVAKMRQVVAADPKIMDAHLTLGTWLQRLHRGEEAIAAFKEALTLRPDDDIALGNLAGALLARGRREDALEAVEVFGAALRVNPKNPQSWHQLAMLYVDLGRPRDARAAFEGALAANPEMAAALNGLAMLAFESGDLEKAEADVRRALELEPRLRTGRFNLARIREARGDARAAEQHYREELDVYPDNGKAQFNLAQLLRSRGDRGQYLSGLRRCVEQAKDFGPCYFFLAREELGAGRLDEAAQLASRGLEAQPHAETAPLGHYVLADVYTRRGRASEARAEVAKARRLESRPSHARPGA